jgi:hypothetical protein
MSIQLKKLHKRFNIRQLQNRIKRIEIKKHFGPKGGHDGHARYIAEFNPNRHHGYTGKWMNEPHGTILQARERRFYSGGG